MSNQRTSDSSTLKAKVENGKKDYWHHLAPSHRFLYSCPRHKLGSLAANFDLMVALAAKDEYYETVYPRDVLGEELIRYSQQVYMYVAEGASDDRAGDIYLRAQTEQKMWHNYARPGSADDYDDDEQEWANMLLLALENPDAIPYIEAGLRNIELIKACFTNGIDVEMAVVLNVSDSTTLLGLVAA